MSHPSEDFHRKFCNGGRIENVNSNDFESDVHRNVTAMTGEQEGMKNELSPEGEVL